MCLYKRRFTLVQPHRWLSLSKTDAVVDSRWWRHMQAVLATEKV